MFLSKLTLKANTTVQDSRKKCEWSYQSSINLTFFCYIYSCSSCKYICFPLFCCLCDCFFSYPYAFSWFVLLSIDIEISILDFFDYEIWHLILSMLIISFAFVGMSCIDVDIVLCVPTTEKTRLEKKSSSLLHSVRNCSTTTSILAIRNLIFLKSIEMHQGTFHTPYIIFFTIRDGC